MKIDISLLFEKPELDSSAVLIIQPLAPLSMVSNLPGSYYKTERIPTKFMICGLFENLLGWHFSIEDRKKIFKEMMTAHKKRHNLILKKQESNVGYQPLVCYYFKTTSQIFLPVMLNYEDLWTQHLIGNDLRHSKGSVHYDWQLEHRREIAKANDDEHNEFFRANKNHFPRYYRGVPKREFVIVKGDFQMKLNMDRRLLKILATMIKENNVGYLGTSEGWVDISFREMKNV